MANLNDLPRMIAENPQVREDLISTLVAFCHKHGIDATPEDFVGLNEGTADTSGHALPTGSGLTGTTLEPPQVLIYRDGPRYSRWVWSG
jgi:hypothetical protein